MGAVHCRAVVLASGGLGQVFSQTTNPAVATGDGMALAYRAGTCSVSRPRRGRRIFEGTGKDCHGRMKRSTP